MMNGTLLIITLHYTQLLSLLTHTNLKSMIFNDQVLSSAPGEYKLRCPIPVKTEDTRDDGTKMGHGTEMEGQQVRRPQSVKKVVWWPSCAWMCILTFFSYLDFWFVF